MVIFSAFFWATNRKSGRMSIRLNYNNLSYIFRTDNSKTPYKGVLTMKALLVVIALVIVIAIISIVISPKPVTNQHQDNVRGSTTDQKQEKAVTTSMTGDKKLGNLMFQTAAVVGVAGRNRCKMVLPSNIRETPLYQLFSLSGIDIENPLDPKPTISIQEKKEGSYTDIILAMDKKHTLEGYYQSPLYFERVRNKIKKIFTPKKEIVDRVVGIIPQLQKQTIGLHVRRGDYLSKEYESMYTHCSIEYYHRAVEYIRQIVGYEMLVIVCSDDISWCKENLDIKNVYFVEGGNSLEDFVTLMLCTHLVIANSSYSWWAAYLSEIRKRNTEQKYIIAPYPWYNVNGPLKHVNSDEIYCPEWGVLLADGTEIKPYKRIRIEKLKNFAIKSFERDTEDEEDRGNVFVVSMDKDSIKWASAKHVLNRAGLDARRFPAVDADVIDRLGGVKRLIEDDMIVSDIQDVISTIGCGLSHMCIWAYCLDKNMEMAYVFEDDIVAWIGKDDLQWRINDALTKMDPDWDFLFLGRCGDKCQAMKEISDGLYRTSYSMCTHAYIISSRGMRKMLSRPLHAGIDIQIVLGTSSGFAKAYAFHPSMFLQNVVKWTSSLRSFAAQIGNQSDCQTIPF
jgi:hypothetical protein